MTNTFINLVFIIEKYSTTSATTLVIAFAIATISITSAINAAN